MKRTLLPLNALRVYDAAARHLSFTKAADELAVTPAAVGQQIRALEDHLGTVLFRRTSKGLELTEEGEAGLDNLREGFLRFEESVSAMQAGQAVDRYAIGAPRGILESWLAPRLAASCASASGRISPKPISTSRSGWPRGRRNFRASRYPSPCGSPSARSTARMPRGAAWAGPATGAIPTRSHASRSAVRARRSPA